MGAFIKKSILSVILFSYCLPTFLTSFGVEFSFFRQTTHHAWVDVWTHTSKCMQFFSFSIFGPHGRPDQTVQLFCFGEFEFITCEFGYNSFFFCNKIDVYNQRPLGRLSAYIPIEKCPVVSCMVSFVYLYMGLSPDVVVLLLRKVALRLNYFETISLY